VGCSNRRKRNFIRYTVIPGKSFLKKEEEMNRKLLIGLILVLAGAFFALKQQDKNRGKKRAPQSLITA